MEFTQMDIENIIKDTVWEVTHIKVSSCEISLLDTSLSINPADFLYIFAILETKLNKPVVDIFKTHNYSVMKVCELAKALMNLPTTEK